MSDRCNARTIDGFLAVRRAQRNALYGSASERHASACAAVDDRIALALDGAFAADEELVTTLLSSMAARRTCVTRPSKRRSGSASTVKVTGFALGKRADIGLLRLERLPLNAPP